MHAVFSNVTCLQHERVKNGIKPLISADSHFRDLTETKCQIHNPPPWGIELTSPWELLKGLGEIATLIGFLQ